MGRDRVFYVFPEILCEKLTIERIRGNDMTKLIDTITDRAALSAHVEGILDQCSYDCHHVHGTTTTLAAIIAPNGHVLAVGMSATVFPETYSAELGAEYAKSDAKSKARQVLFETTTWQMRSERFEVE